jgi:hypothetical protein
MRLFPIPIPAETAACPFLRHRFDPPPNDIELHASFVKAILIP